MVAGSGERRSTLGSYKFIQDAAGEVYRSRRIEEAIAAGRLYRQLQAHAGRLQLRSAPGGYMAVTEECTERCSGKEELTTRAMVGLHTTEQSRPYAARILGYVYDLYETTVSINP